MPATLLITPPGHASPLQEAPLRRALDTTDDAIVISNGQDQVVYANAGFTRLFGFPLPELPGKRLADLLLGPHSDPGLAHAICQSLATQGHFRGEALLYDHRGQSRWTSMVINALHDASGAADGRITVLTDITLTKMHEVLQKRVLEGMVNEIPLPELMGLVCAQVERIAPEVTASILAVDEKGLLHPLAAPGLPKAICRALDGVPIGPMVGSCGTAAFRGEPVVVTDITTDPLWADYHRLFEPSGMRACWSSPIRNHRGQVVGTFAFYFREPRAPDASHQHLVDVCLHLCALAIERDTARRRIHQLAFFDTLTGLPNRVQFRSNAEGALAHLQRSGGTGALLFVDLDRFKQVNDTQGHAAGDALLEAVAHRLVQACRRQDLVGRLAGDEFVAFLPGCTQDEALPAAQHLLDTIAAPLDIHGQIHVPNASIGIAMYPGDGDDIDTLLSHADQAMYQAKKEHPHGVRFFSADLSLHAQERAALERALRQALSDGSLHLHYQPQVLNDAAHTLHGVEALARWQHPDWGVITPARFIPVAEETGLIHELTLWLLDAAFGQLARWRAAGCNVPCVAVNLSGRSFHQPEFAGQIGAALERHGLQGKDVLLEITESVMMDVRPVTAANIVALHRQGFRLSLDDFGTGYSSLSYLHRLPIAELKLDMAFVRDLTSSATARALTRSVLSIAHSLGMEVVAEGVETQEQSDWLREHGCPVMQGYLFGKPMSAEDLEAWMKTRLQPRTQAESLA